MSRLSLRVRRWRAARRGAVADALRECWERESPALSAPVENVEFLVCDGEMSGLDPASAELLSLGWVLIRDTEIDLGSAEHHLIRPDASVGHSATVHRLRDCELREGAAQAAVLQRFLEVAGGRVLVFHHAPLDLAFLDKACTQLFAAPLLMPTVDTLRLEHRQMTRREQTIGEGDLRLAACRERYGLPPHAAHSALDDALATAELLLAQLATRGTGVRLRDLS